MTHSRFLSIGTELAATASHFRVWAPRADQVEVCFEGGTPAAPLRNEGNGFFSGLVEDAGPGSLYRYRLDSAGPFPDPCSRFQPRGPDGPSLVVDHDAYIWHDSTWTGLRIQGQVMYELHVGAFTREGTFDAAIPELRKLADLGITCIELLPIAEFAGDFNWGYDGVALFAPYHGYGDYEALKRFVDAAHELNVGVILDVVYNHFGGEGCYLDRYSRDYVTDRHANDWGDAVNFDGTNSQPVRDFVIDNACYWIREFHLDGLRLDATQSIMDSSHPHLLACLSERARAAAAPRDILLVAENEPQLSWMMDPIESGGYGLDAMWNDDFHHSSRVALTGRHDGYFRDYRGRAQEFISCVRHGFLFQGQHYDWHNAPRGTPGLKRSAASLIAFTQNHDQVGNTLSGLRIDSLASAARNRAVTALLLLAPHTPLLFMGQEFGATTPFAFFADHSAELAPKVDAGRKESMRCFAQYATAAAQATMMDPSKSETFARSKLDFAERKTHENIYTMYRDLLQLRRHDPVISRQERDCIDGAVLSENALVLRWFDQEHGDRLLLLNLGLDLTLRPAPEPLLAPVNGSSWCLLWSSDDPRYGGLGVVDPVSTAWWNLPSETASFFRTTPRVRS